MRLDITRNKLGLEDIKTSGVETQSRGGSEVTVTGITVDNLVYRDPSINPDGDEVPLTLAEAYTAAGDFLLFYDSNIESFNNLESLRQTMINMETTLNQIKSLLVTYGSIFPTAFYESNFRPIASTHLSGSIIVANNTDLLIFDTTVIDPGTTFNLTGNARVIKVRGVVT